MLENLGLRVIATAFDLSGRSMLLSFVPMPAMRVGGGEGVRSGWGMVGWLMDSLRRQGK